MMGAGIKDKNNNFNGVLMGDVESKVDSSVRQIGLYGYNEGIQSFGFKVDGTAFIGKTGKGQLVFDGNKGVIQSGGYTNTGTLKQGMQIDLDGSDGKSSSLKAFGTGGSFELDTKANGNLLSIKSNTTEVVRIEPDGRFWLKSVNGGTVIDLFKSEATFTGPGGKIAIDASNKPNGTVFKIDGNWIDENNKEQTTTLMNVGSGNNFYFQTANFNTDNKTGTKIDLGKGVITSYDFKIDAAQSKNDANGVIKVDSGANKYPLMIGQGNESNKKFKVTWDGSLEATNAKIKGEITATSGTIGGCAISGGILKINSANIGKVSINDLTFKGKNIEAKEISVISGTRLTSAGQLQYKTTKLTVLGSGGTSAWTNGGGFEYRLGGKTKIKRRSI